MKADQFIPAFTLGCMAGIVLCMLLVAIGREMAPDYKQEALDRGYARYHPQTGEFEWVERGEEETNDQPTRP